MSKPKLQCIFCATPTNFEDGGRAYCIDCYCKLRNSAHTHDAPGMPPKRLPITPMPDISKLLEPFVTDPSPNRQIIC